MNTTKEKRNCSRTVRYTKTEDSKIEKEAATYQMDVSAYIRDKSLNGKERKNYQRRITNTRIVEISHAVDIIYDHIAKTNSDYILKTDLIPLIDNVKKGCNALWKR